MIYYNLDVYTCSIQSINFGRKLKEEGGGAKPSEKLKHFNSWLQK